VFFTSFLLGGGWAGKPENPTKKHFFCVRHAEGMRKHGANRTEAIAQPVARRLRSRNAQKSLIYTCRWIKRIFFNTILQLIIFFLQLFFVFFGNVIFFFEF
jgi:hypothetical protein